MEIQVFSGTAHPELSRQIAIELDMQLGAVEVRQFPDGEVFVKYCESIRNKDVFIIQPTCGQPNEKIMELLVMLDAAKRASAARITAVLPFYGYARQDRKDQPRVPITAKLIANLLVTAGADRILTMDLHADQIQGFFDIPVDHLHAAPVIARHLKTILPESSIVVAPDVGSVKMAQTYGDMLKMEIAIVAKRRVNDTDVKSSHLVGDVKGKDCVLVDDMTTTAGTLTAAAALLQSAGANRIFAAVSHTCMTEIGCCRLNQSPIEKLISTNSTPQPDACCRNPKLEIVCVAGLLAEAIRRIHKGVSVSTLFRQKTAIT